MPSTAPGGGWSIAGKRSGRGGATRDAMQALLGWGMGSQLTPLCCNTSGPSICRPLQWTRPRRALQPMGPLRISALRVRACHGPFKSPPWSEARPEVACTPCELSDPLLLASASSAFLSRSARGPATFCNFGGPSGGRPRLRPLVSASARAVREREVGRCLYRREPATAFL